MTRLYKSHPAYLTYMQSVSCEMPGWMKHKLEIKIAGKNINNIRYADDTTLMAEYWASLVAQLVKNPPAMQESWVQYLGWEDPLEKGKAIHSSINMEKKCSKHDLGQNCLGLPLVAQLVKNLLAMQETLV